MQLDLSGKTVLVTGASRGIGFAVARQMADAGASVAAHFYSNGDRISDLQNAAGRVEPFQADLASTSECERLFGEVVDRMGRIDVLVNNAGVAVYAPLSASVEEWERAWNLTLGVNLRAAELLCRLSIAHFREHGGGGRIINIASRAAFRGDMPEYMTYAASKGGLVALTRSIARGCGADGVRAFVVAPGFVRTDMAQDFINEFGEAHAMKDLATQRLTEPHDVAPTVVFLASGLADHATGCTIDINAASYVH